MAEFEIGDIAPQVAQDTQPDPPSKALYNALVSTNKYNLPNYEQFSADMRDVNKRKKLLETVKGEGLYGKDRTLNDFNAHFFTDIDVKKKETTSSVSSPVAPQPTKPSVPIQNSFGIETPNTTQETQSIIGGQQVTPSSSIALNQSQYGWSDSPNQTPVAPQYATTAPFDQSSDQYRKDAKEKDLAKQSTSAEFTNTLLNPNSPLIQNKSLFAQSLVRETKPEEQAMIQQNFSNLKPEYQQDIANYLAKVQVDNPNKHAELVSRIGENGLDQKTKATILSQATNDRLQKAARDFSILEARNKQGKEINPNDAEKAIGEYNQSINDMSQVLQQFPEEIDRLRKVKAQNDEMTIKDSDSFLVKAAKQTGALLGGVQNSILDGAKSTLEWARDISDQLSGEQDTRGLTDKAVEGIGNFLDSWHAATPTKYKDEKDLQGENAGGAQEFIAQLGAQFGNMGMLYALGAGSKARLVTAGAATSYSQYYDEADKTGKLSKDGVQKYALFQSTIQGLLELVNPNFGAAEFEKVGLKSGIEFLKNNPNANVGNYVKNVFKETIGENAQELTQNTGGVLGKVAANALIGKDVFDPSMTAEKQMQTVTMTTATTLLASFITKGRFRDYHRQSLDFLRNIPEAKLIDELNQQVQDGNLTYTQADKIKTLVNDKENTPVVEGEKQTAKESSTPSIETPKIIEQVDSNGNLVPIEKIKTAEKVQEVDLQTVTKDELLNESKPTKTAKPSEPIKEEVKPIVAADAAVEPTLAETVTAPQEETKTATTDTPTVVQSEPSRQSEAEPSAAESNTESVIEPETPDQRKERVNRTILDAKLPKNTEKAVVGVINNTKDAKLFDVLPKAEKAKAQKLISDIYAEDKKNAPVTEVPPEAVKEPAKAKPKTQLQKGQTVGSNNKNVAEFEPTSIKEEIEQHLASGGKINEQDFKDFFGDGKGGTQAEMAKWKGSIDPTAPSLDQVSENFKFKEGAAATDVKNAFQEVLSENGSAADVRKNVESKHKERKATLEGKNNPFETPEYEANMKALEAEKERQQSKKEVTDEEKKAYHEHATKVDALQAQAEADPSVKAKHDALFEKIANDPQYQKADGSFDYEKLSDNVKDGFEPDLIELTSENETDSENANRIGQAVKSVRDAKTVESGGDNKGKQGDGGKGGNERGVESQMNDSWRKEFERAKSENDLKALDTLYSKVRVVLNGIAQSKGNATVKAFQDFKKEMEDYAGELKAKKEVFKPNTPTEINDTNLVESIDGAEQHIEEVKAALDTEIAKAELDLKRAGRETLMNAGLPINPRQIEAATKLVYLKFKKFMYDTGIAPKLQEMADAIGVAVSERFKGIYDNVKAIWSIENSSGFHESLGYFAQARRMFQDKNLAIKALFKDLEKMNVPIDDSTNFAEIQELTTSRIADAQRRAAEWFRGMKGGDKILGTTESKKQSWVGRVIAEVGSYETQRDYMYANHALDYNARAREIFEKRREEAIKPLQEEADALTEDFLKETDLKEQKKLQDKITKLNNEITELENEVVPDAPSGMTDTEAQAILDEAAKDPAKMAKMDALAKEFRDNTVVKRIDLLEKSGMINAETAQNMREGKREGFTTEMPNYLPLKVKSENFTEGMRPTTSMGKLGTQIFGIQVTDKYGKAQRYDPLQMAMTELQATQSAAINNEALVSLYNAVKQSPFGKNIKIINSRGTYAANEHGELTDTKTDANVEVRDLLNDHAIPFKVDGKIKYLFFTPIKNEKGQLIKHPIIQALKANPASTGTFAKALLNVVRTMTNYLRLIRTTYNLGFAADNPFRDLGEALTNISDLDKDGMKVEKVRLQIIKNMPTAFGFFFNPSKKRLSLKGRTLTVGQEKEFQKYWDEMRENGVMMSWGNYEGIDEKIDDFEKDIQRMEQGKFGKTGAEQAATTFKVLGALSEATENTTRIAVFAAMRQNGYSAQKAAYVAKNVTLNFEKGGTATKWTNMLWMFSNAGIQGTTRMLKAAKSKNFWRFGATMTAFAFANRSLLLSLMDDDDEDKWIYNNLENQGRTLIYNPLDPKNPIRLPKPYSAMRLFLNLGEGMADIKNGKRTTSDVAVDNIASTLTSSIDPIGGSGNSLTNYVPFEPLRNFVQIRANQNWAGQEIMRGEDKLEDKKIADHLRSNPSTDAIFDKAALGLYNTTGLSVQPTTIEYFWDDYGKNAAKSVTDYVKIGSILYDKTTGKEVKAEEIPAIKRFYTNVDDKRGTVLYGVMDLIKDPTQGTPEQIRYIEKQLPKLEADKTISQYFIKRIKDGLAEMKDPTIKQKRDAKNTGDFEKNIELKESKQTVKQIKGK